MITLSGLYFSPGVTLVFYRGCISFTTLRPLGQVFFFIYFKMEEVVDCNAVITATGPAPTFCAKCAKRKRDDDEAEKVHQLKLSLFSQERYWLNDSEEEDSLEYPMSRQDAVASLCASNYFEDNK